MKATLAVVAFTLLIPVTARAQDGKLDLSFLDRLEKIASEHASITIDSSTLGLAGQFMPNTKESAAAKEVIAGLKGIFVRSFEFDSDNAYSTDDINAVRKQLAGWNRIISSSEKGGDLAEVYLFQQAGKINGITILAAERRELTVVNIVGPIDLSKLKLLEGQFGIPTVGQ
jgi:uncharacterized protein DUF4252